MLPNSTLYPWACAPQPHGQHEQVPVANGGQAPRNTHQSSLTLTLPVELFPFCLGSFPACRLWASGEVLVSGLLWGAPLAGGSPGGRAPCPAGSSSLLLPQAWESSVASGSWPGAPLPHSTLSPAVSLCSVVVPSPALSPGAAALGAGAAPLAVLLCSAGLSPSASRLPASFPRWAKSLSPSGVSPLASASPSAPGFAPSLPGGWIS